MICGPSRVHGLSDVTESRVHRLSNVTESRVHRLFPSGPVNKC